MYRVSLFVFFAALVAVVVAAPVPFPKERGIRGPWIDGWEPPLNPLKDCRFERNGSKLSIFVPGAGHEHDGLTGRSSSPALLREVDGNFAVQVRVWDSFRLQSTDGTEVSRRAGLLLTNGKQFVRLQRSVYCGGWMAPCHVSAEINEPTFGRSIVGTADPMLAGPVYLRLEREGDAVRLSYSRDGNFWMHAHDPLSSKWPNRVVLPRRLKVGVMVEATADGKFSAEFDEFCVIRPPYRRSEDTLFWQLDR